MNACICEPAARAGDGVQSIGFSAICCPVLLVLWCLAPNAIESGRD
jgi:hypothetical protein